MSDIRIQDLPQADFQQPRDMIAIQRYVAGVPTDFNTDFATLGGDVQIAIVDDSFTSGVSVDIVTPGAGEIAVYLSASIVYTPDEVPNGLSPGMTITQGANVLTSISIVADSTAGSYSPPDADIANELDQPITVSWGPNAAGSGRLRVIVQYLLIDV